MAMYYKTHVGIMSWSTKGWPPLTDKYSLSIISCKIPTTLTTDPAYWAIGGLSDHVGQVYFMCD